MISEFVRNTSNNMFKQQAGFHSLWDMLLDNFAPDMIAMGSDGNYIVRSPRQETSYPVRVARDLSNILAATLRPADRVWFHVKTPDYDDLGDDARIFLDKVRYKLYNALYDPKSGFSRTVEEIDKILPVLGGGVISCEVDWENMRLLFRSWSLRDCAWIEGNNREIVRVDRKWRPSIYQLKSEFGEEALSSKCLELLKNNRLDVRVRVRHTFMLAKDYPEKEFKHKYLSIFWEEETGHVLSMTDRPVPFYAVTRWTLLQDCPYPISPCSYVALSDARMLQDMMGSVLDAAELATNPPYAVVDEAILGDYNLYAGGVISVEGGNKVNDVIKPIYMGNGAGVGQAMIDRVKEDLRSTFFLDKIGLPPLGGGMSPFEVSQRVNEWVQSSLPLFAPLENDYIAGLLNLAFENAFAAGILGNINDVPDELSGKSVRFTFTNPLREAVKRTSGDMFTQSLMMAGQAMQYDPSAGMVLNVPRALESALEDIGTPQSWFTSDEERMQMVEAQRQMQEMEVMNELLSRGDEVPAVDGEAGGGVEGVAQGGSQ